MTTTNATIDSKFRMILVAAKRARQLQSGAKPLVHTVVRKSTRVAQEELKAGVLPYEVLEIEPAEEIPGETRKESSHATKTKKQL